MNTEKIHICIAANYHLSERIGGSEVQAWLLAEELAKRGYKVSYVCESLNKKENQTEIINNVEIHWLAHYHFFDIFNLRQYYKKLKSLTPDYIVQRYTSIYSGAIGYYSKYYKIPYMWICADDQIPKNNLFSFRLKQQLEKSATKLHKKIVLLAYAKVRDLCRNYGMKNVTHPCVQNELQKQLIKKNFNLDTKMFHSGHKIPSEKITKASPKIVLWVGSFSKRPEYFLQLFDQCKSLNLHFVMISKPASKKNKTMLNTIEQYNKQYNNFQWLATVPLEEALSWFNKSSFFINSSELEGFPNTYVQAWLRSVPVLSFGFDPDDTITKNELGWVVKSHVEAKTIIENALTDTHFEKFTDNLYQYAVKNHSIESVADNFLDILLSSSEKKSY